MGWLGGNHHFVKYGIEQLFVEQGSGKAIEKHRGGRDDLQVPMEVEVAVGSSSTAVIRGYRWSRLGMKLEMLRRPAPRDRNVPPPLAPMGPQTPLSPRLGLTLANTSTAPLAVVDPGEPGDHCGFHLVQVEWVGEAYPPASPCVADGSAKAIILAPGQTYRVELDLSEPRWHVLAGGKAIEIGALPAVAQFRVEYRAPPADRAPAAPGTSGRADWRRRRSTRTA